MSWVVSFHDGEIILSARNGDRFGSVSFWDDGEIVLAVSGRDEKTQVVNETARRAVERLGDWIGERIHGEDGDAALPPHGFVESVKGRATD